MALAAVNYTIVHSPLILLLTLLLFVHEMGHYIISKYFNANPSYPIFIPLPFFAIGLTRVRDLDPKYKASVALAGILFSVSFILNMMLHNYFLGMFSFASLSTILFLELFFNIFGSDGIRYRKAKKFSI
jgi:hypothetical protein